MIYSSFFASWNLSLLMHTIRFRANFCLVLTSSASQINPKEPSESSLIYLIVLPLMWKVWGVRVTSLIAEKLTVGVFLPKGFFPFTIFSKSSNMPLIITITKLLQLKIIWHHSFYCIFLTMFCHGGSLFNWELPKNPGSFLYRQEVSIAQNWGTSIIQHLYQLRSFVSLRNNFLFEMAWF